MTPEDIAEVRRLRSEWLRVQNVVAYVGVLFAGRRYLQALKREERFNPNHDGRGRFTTADGASSGGAGDDAGRVQVAQADSSRYSVDLSSQDKALGGHTIRDHVAKSDEELLDVVRRDRFDFGTVTIARKSQGSFLSEESANDFVNRTLESYPERVDAVAAGTEDEAVLNKRFGFVTGKEAYRPDVDAEPYIRPTYSVRIIIQTDNRSKKGYKVFTAFPTNENPQDQ